MTLKLQLILQLFDAPKRCESILSLVTGEFRRVLSVIIEVLALHILEFGKINLWEF